MHSFFDVILLIALGFPPIAIAYIWWTSLRTSPNNLPRWRRIIFLSGLCGGTANLVVWWTWVIWLAFHRGTPNTWKVWDKMSDLGLCLILVSIFASLVGKGRNRILLAVAGILAILPWIPVGVL
jgi:hypothetical protein